ncbi:MAG: class I SAM-dependent methyltransferase, partial [Desulfobacterales bacterium]
MTIDVDPDWWKTLFDEVYLVTDARSVGDDDITRQEIDIFLALVPMQSDDRILDLCGGHGRHTLELCRRGFHDCTVLDYSQPLLDIGARVADQ